MLKTIILALLVIIAYCINSSKDCSKIEQLIKETENGFMILELQKGYNIIKQTSALASQAEKGLSSSLDSIHSIDQIYHKKQVQEPNKKGPTRKPPIQVTEPKQTQYDYQMAAKILSKIRNTIRILPEIQEIYSKVYSLEQDIQGFVRTHKILDRDRDDRLILDMIERNQKQIIECKGKKHERNDLLESSSSSDEEETHPIDASKTSAKTGQSTQSAKKSQAIIKHHGIHKSITGHKKLKAKQARKKLINVENS